MYLDDFAHLRGTNILFHDPRQNCPAPSSHETNVLCKFHENWAKNVTSTVFTCFHYIHIEKNARPTGGHVFSPISTIFEHENFPAHWRPYIIKTNILTNFELGQDFIGTKLLTNFHEDGTRNSASRVLTSKC
ncbi:hypothetical protein DPMN_001076 [Dreissena polymorpha]|uniref:Uncharacterized protein n=1 Tax=Dreissena polymorpha TaxID=45954 RepID=A0A9D4RSL7_DREPO|nr:hypothetical protein DPMN_001076 [Dreissena polymorpha]